MSSCGHFCRLHQTSILAPPDPRCPTTISWDVDASRWECWNSWSFYNPFIVFKGAKKVRSKGCLVNVSLNTFGILAYNLAGIIWPNNITTCILKTLYHHGCSWLVSLAAKYTTKSQIPSDPFLSKVGPEGGTYRNPPKKLPCHKIPSIFQPKIWCGKDWQRLVDCSGKILLGFLWTLGVPQNHLTVKKTEMCFWDLLLLQHVVSPSWCKGGPHQGWKSLLKVSRYEKGRT